MSRHGAVWNLLFLLVMPSVATAADGPKTDPVVQIDAVVGEYGFDRPDEPGLSLIVIKEGKVLFKKAYGLADVEAKIPNTTGTNFRLASVSKQFTAMATLILAEQGKLRLDSRLTDLIPDFPEYGRDITIRHLLGHTAGLPDAFDLAPTIRDGQLRDGDLFEILRRQTRCDFPPGSKYRYSNTGYVVLGLVVEKVSGLPFAVFLKRHIFEPLGMVNTSVYEPPGTTVRHRAYGYTPAGDGFRRTDQNRTSGTLGDGGVYSSVDDLYRWDQALYTTKLVGESTLAQVFTAGTYGEGRKSSYGFGWSIEDARGFRKVSHEGVSIGFRNVIQRLPDVRFTVVVLMNRADGVPTRIANRIARLYYPALAAPAPAVADVSRADLGSFAGYYDAGGSTLTVARRGSRLSWAGFGPRPMELLPVSAESFFCADPDADPARDWRVAFDKGTEGRATHLIYQSGGKEVFRAHYLGPLSRSATPQPDPDPKTTRTVEAALKAFAQGGRAVEQVAGLTEGARKNFVSGQQFDLAGLRSLSFVGAWDVSGGLERHGAKVKRVLYYRFDTGRTNRFVVIFMTAGGLIADEDVVDD